MKKFLLFSTLIFVLMFSGCTGSTKETTEVTTNETTTETIEATKATEESTTSETKPTTTSALNVYSLKGATSIGLVKLMNDTETATDKAYNFNMVTAADEIVPKIVKGEADIALVPANLAATLYKKTEGKISVIDINTLSVLYVVENSNQISSIADLKGKTIYMTGKGTVPEFTIKYLLSKNGISESDVTIEFKSEPTEVAALLKNQENVVAILPQPFVTVATTQAENIHIALDLNEEWMKLDSNSSIVTGVTICRNEVIENNPELVAKFISDHEVSANYVNTNVDDASTLVEKYGIIKAPIAKKAIPYCNVTCISKDDMKNKLSGYLQALFEQNPESVGGTLPDEAFYYTK